MILQSSQLPTVRTAAVLAKDFNAGVYELIAMAERKTRDEMTQANLYRAKKRLNTLIWTSGDVTPLAEAYPFWNDYSDRILEADPVVRDNFFLTLDIRAEYAKYGKVVNPEDEFLFSLTDAIRELYKKSSADDKGRVYAIVKRLHDCGLEYALGLV